MDRDTELALLRRGIARAREGSPDQGATQHRSPIDRYLDSARYECELTSIFRRVPQIVAHASELPEPSAFVTRTLYGVPILITRNKAGAIGAFLNVCRHRGTRLVDAPRGVRPRFSCPYHAWTYDLDGALVGVRQREGFPHLDMAESGLVRLSAEERHGFVWLSLDRGTNVDVASYLGAELDRELTAYALDALEPYRPEHRRWAANYKLLVEGGLEAYHFKIAHARTIAPLFCDNVFLGDRFGDPFRDHFRNVLLKSSVRALEGTDEAEWRLRDHANILYTLFPHTALLVQSDHVAWITFTPVAVDATDVTIALLVPKGPRDERTERRWEKNHALTLPTLAVDFALAESIQSTLASGANDALTFGTYEHQLEAFHETLERWTTR
ncbi:MAG: aromatic ring-hydroxylating dioxygenase subunit alpha, partial [Sandaracinaceae bacterium]